ncbi:Protein kinase superfamily protein [Prunus dulcis]|uniref:Protein kinase superfamily protein n=1 Tax=Prunus dulcis TaxID=3755 RepID=A0A5H2XMJ9_PRUDU|nr:Protein kinase superfamily protein [Prunus dulcis]
MVAIRHAWHRSTDHLPSPTRQPSHQTCTQKRRNSPERVAIIEAEINKLLAAGFIQEVSYAEWLANVVLVAKKDKGLWRVCVDYTDLNKACPKDNFPLPRIDQLVIQLPQPTAKLHGPYSGYKNHDA